MKRNESISIFTLVLLTILLLLGVHEELWSLNEILSLGPYFIMAGMIGIFLWGFRERIERLFKSSERLERVRTKRGQLLAFQIDSTTGWFKVGIEKGQLYSADSKSITEGYGKITCHRNYFQVNCEGYPRFKGLIEATFELGKGNVVLRKDDWGELEVIVLDGQTTTMLGGRRYRAGIVSENEYRFPLIFDKSIIRLHRINMEDAMYRAFDWLLRKTWQDTQQVYGFDSRITRSEKRFIEIEGTFQNLAGLVHAFHVRISQDGTVQEKESFVKLRS